MRIKQIVHQHRRDFRAIYECEHCGHTYEDWGYDDAHFHSDVVPTKVCPKCGKAADTGYRPLTTKYPEGMQV